MNASLAPTRLRVARRHVSGAVRWVLVLAVLAVGLLVPWFMFRTAQMPVAMDLRSARPEAKAQASSAQLEHTFADAVEEDVRTVLLEPDPAPQLQPEAEDARVDGYQLVGRAVDAHGNPLARAQLQARFTDGLDRSNYWSTRSVRLETDAEGRFEWRLARDAEFAGQTAWFLKVGVVDLYAESALPLVLAPNHDLGDVRFEPAPLLVSGHVVDAGGQPIADAHLMLQSFPDVDGVRRSRHTAKHMVKTDSAGNFTILGHAPIGMLELQAVGGNDHLATTREVFAGERDVVMVLADAAKIQGRLLLDEGIDPLDLHLIVISSDKSRSWTPKLDGTFEILGIPLGSARLALSGRCWAGPALDLFELEVVRGGSDDPRLDPIDLRGVLMQTHFYVEDSSGNLIDTVLVRDRGEAPSQELPRRVVFLLDGGKTISNDGFHVFLHAKLVEVDVLAPGMRAAPCTLAGREIRLRMMPGIEVRVHIRGTEQLPKQINASATLNIPHAIRGGLQANTHEAGSFRLPSAGAWKGWVDVMFVSDTRVTIHRGQDFLIDVADTEGIQHFEIQLDATTLELATELHARYAE